jgi:hypothetical protein
MVYFHIAKSFDKTPLGVFGFQAVQTISMRFRTTKNSRSAPCQRAGAFIFPLPLQRVHILTLFGEFPVVPLPRQSGQTSSSLAVSVRRPPGIRSIPIFVPPFESRCNSFKTAP